MKILKNIETPTGNICIVQGDKGLLEFLSLGDYGKEKNLKADFLGLNKEIDGVPHESLLLLEEKWVITVSTQTSCRCKCNFCDVPKVPQSCENATTKDLIKQVLEGIKLHPEVKSTNRLNIHFARMGEPTWNPNVLDATKWLKTHVDPEYKIHPVVSTMMPKRNEWLKTFIHTWMRIKNRLLQGNAGLQISINSTDERQREEIFGGHALELENIARVMEGIIPNGRKITLNFALDDSYIINPDVLIKYFDPDDYLIKITPIHNTKACQDNKLYTSGGYEYYDIYRGAEKMLKRFGYDVIVFIPSVEEDESRITCGNAILSDLKTAGDIYK